jgi:hypothetical protein
LPFSCLAQLVLQATTTTTTTTTQLSICLQN